MRRPRRAAMIAGAVVALIAVVLTGGWALAFRDRPADPQTVTLPPTSAKSAASHGYFAGAGKPLIALMQVTAHLPDQNTPGGCLQIAKIRLAPLGSPRALADIAARVPDAAARSAAIQQVQFVHAYLAACGSKADLSGPAHDLQFNSVVLARLVHRASAT